MSSFETGSFYITRGVDAEMKKNRRFRMFLIDSIRKYVNKDWGDTPSKDAELNEQALESERDYWPFMIIPNRPI